MTSGNNGGRKAVFFDRDGVLNRLVLRDGRHVSPRSVEEFQLYAEAAAAAADLRANGFLVFLVSNQPDVARGALSTADLDRMTAMLRKEVHLDGVAICTHDDRDACRCRKPAPGMIVDLAREWGVDLDRSFIVGDSWRDMEAGRGAGCTTILVARDGTENGTQPASDARVRDLDAAVQYIVSH
jgi:D-glycero-D-manno-heptose 1,7-bisphosphate phosphatase